MAKTGPIILIEDDADDQDLFRLALQDLKVTNPLHVFSDCREGLTYLSATSERPFIIFCDINMPFMSGLDFKQLIDDDPNLRKKSIPFLFYSTCVNQVDVNRAYLNMTIQGFFEKPAKYAVKCDLIKSILDYWGNCQHPNS